MRLHAGFRLSVFLILASPLLPAADARPPREFPVAEAASQNDVYPDRVTRFAGGVTGLADVTYSVLPGYRPLVLDLYLPSGRQSRPLVLFIHGGGWVGGNTRHSGALADFPRALAKLAAEGFVVASVEYRLAAEAPFPAALQDVRAALRFLRTHAQKYRIDGAKVAVWGGSAGGHLAALAALSCGDRTLDPPGAAASAPGSECVQGAVIWYGVFDYAPVAARATDANARTFLGCQGPCSADIVRRASPVSYISRGDPPFLLIHGEADRVVEVGQSRTGEAALQAAGVPVRSIYIPGVDHSFVGRAAAETRTATLLATNATFDFFHDLFDGDKP
jgi:acetyl esterase/lipase